MHTHCVQVGKFFMVCIYLYQVTHWPKSDYGKFYDGDSYIILNTYKKDPTSEVMVISSIYICVDIYTKH